MNLLVTGAGGFVGTRVAHHLEQTGHAVTRTVGDVRDKSNHPPQQFAAIVHLAALISHRGDHGADEFFAVNVGGTQALLESYPTAHFVYVSTTDVARATLSDYARSKLEAEHLVAQRPSYCIVRLPSVFGPEQRQASKLIPRLIRAHVLNEPRPPLTDEARPCLYVDDAATAIGRALHQQGLVSVSGQTIHNRDLDGLIAAATRNDASDALALRHSKLFGQLRECVDAFRQRGQPTTA